MLPSTEVQPPQGQFSNSSYWFTTWNEDQMKSQEVFRETECSDASQNLVSMLGCMSLLERGMECW